MACLLQRITSMKLQNNWYVWQINLDLSSSCLVAHKARVLLLISIAAMVFASFHDCHPASTLSFSTVCLQAVFGFPLHLFFFLVPKSLLCCSVAFLDWSCHSILCPIIFHLCCFPSLLKGFMSALFSHSSVLTW